MPEGLDVGIRGAMLGGPSGSPTSEGVAYVGRGREADCKECLPQDPHERRTGKWVEAGWPQAKEGGLGRAA